MTAFVHLRAHSEYSLVDGLLRIKSFVAGVEAARMPAVALTDESNVFGLLKFYRQALGQGIQPILGVDCWVESAIGPSRLTLLAMNHTGYLQILQLVSLGWQSGQVDGKPVLRDEWLSAHSDGLIVLSGGIDGELARLVDAGRLAEGEQRAAILADRYPNRFYLEISRLGRPGESQWIAQAAVWASQLNLPLVATNPICFMRQEDFEAHETRVCIHEGYTIDDGSRLRRHTDQQYLKNPEEMRALFPDFPDALANTVAIAQRCGVALTLGTYFLPNYPIPEGMTLDGFFREESRKGLATRLAALPSADASNQDQSQNDHYHDRLEFEVGVILQMGFPGYFLIVADFIRWAKSQAIPVGPGRGSGAGSIVAWALGITDLDPIEHDLLFERFLNPERVSMPDFDVDFCMEGRDRVIDYVAQRYGRQAVSQIVTFGSMAAKAVVRDVTRVQGKPYGLGDRLAKLIPFEVGMTLDKAYEAEPQLSEWLNSDDDAREVWEMSLKLEGITRNVGKHAGGVVIAPGRLTDFTALLSDAQGGGLVTQYDKDDVEAAGLVKFDFLGLRTLTILDWALALIRDQHGDAPHIDQLPMQDKTVFDMLCRAETTAIFQLESRGMKELIRRLKPESFEEIVALVALFRPGPLQSGMVDDFINRKHGKAQVSYPHPDLEAILKNTYGVILYQEQVMQIAQILAGYSLGEADLLRRAMGKKKPEEMAKQREIFLEGTTQRGIGATLSNSIFDLMEKFAGYGFNKSHSAAYALVSYQTAYLKAHYPAEFMAAVLSSDMDNTDKVVPLIEECRRMGLTVRPPDINRGTFKFSVANGEIVYGLGAIKGLGEGPVQAIVESRSEAGDYSDVFDFCARIATQKINKRALEALIRAGAFDALGVSRWIVMATVEDAVLQADQFARNEASGMVDLFGLGATAADLPADPYQHHRQTPRWSERDQLRGEKETLGLYLTGHPIDAYGQDLRGIGARSLDTLERTKDTVRVAGLIVGLRVVRNKRGESFAIMTLDDRTARVDVTVFADLFQSCRDICVDDQLVVVDGDVSFDEFSQGLKMRATKVDTLAAARQSSASALEMTLEQLSAKSLDTLSQLLAPYRGGECPVRIAYTTRDAKGRIQLGPDWAVSPSDELLVALREWAGDRHVSLAFSKGIH
jgi:DNA polymerase III subunit alpha